MLDQNTTTAVDLTDVDEVEKLVREIALMICEEQPDMPEPESLTDLDSFSVVQVLLEVENTTGRKLLEKFEDFTEGEEFRDLAAYIVKIVAEEDADIAAGIDPDAPAPATTEDAATPDDAADATAGKPAEAPAEAPVAIPVGEVTATSPAATPDAPPDPAAGRPGDGRATA